MHISFNCRSPKERPWSKDLLFKFFPESQRGKDGMKHLTKV